MAQLALTLLGPLQARLDGVPIAGFESQKVRALLVYLALEADRPHQRDTLAGLLWPDLPDQAARTNLRQALANLRQALGDGRATPLFVQVIGATIQFNHASNYQIDVASFTDLLDACDRHPHRHPEICTSCAKRRQQAVDHYHGEFLAGFFLADSAAFEEWALLKREQLHGSMITALGQLASYHERRGEYALAERLTRHQLELDPWREESHRQLMRVLALNGQRSVALVQYAACRRILAAELGVAPEEATITLCAQIQRGEVVPAVRRRPPSNLAAHTPLTPLIGRETELADIADRLERRDCRLLTLVGPGGIGKTRLALAVAAEQSASFRDGVAFVLLAPVSAAELLVPAIANAVGVRFTGSAEPQAQLLASLRTKEMLLVLDNVEHLLAVAPLVSELLVACPDLTVLVTSRARLHLSAEQQFPVPSLALPSLRQLSDNIRLTQYAAVALFVARAQAIQPAFQLTATTATTVATICVRLDGLPLAIELAAARITLLTPDAILSRLSNALGLLTGGARDVPVRQQTLRNTIDWSYTLLSPKEQILFRRLAVFVDGWTLAAAEAIGRSEDEAIDVLDTLQTLVDHSLLHQEADSAGETRFRLLETIRQYVLERLEECGEAEFVRQRQAGYYLALAEAAHTQLHGAERRRWLDRVEDEHNNLRATLTWALQGGDVEIGGRLVVALAGSRSGGSLWSARDPREAGRWLEAVLAQRSAVSPAIRARALLRTAKLPWQTKERAQACVEALALFRAVGDRSGIAATLTEQGAGAVILGDHVQAIQHCEASLALYRELGDRHGIATTLHVLGDIMLDQGDTDRAVALLEESLALCREQGFVVEAPLVLCALGEVPRVQRDYPRAIALYWEAVALFQQVGERWNILAPLLNLGWLALAQDDDGRVRVLLEEQVGWFRKEATPIGLAHVLHVLGAVVNAQGDATQATGLLREALILQQQFGRVDLLMESLELYAGLVAGQDQPIRAARLLGATEVLRTGAHMKRFGAQQAPYDHTCVTARAQLDDATFAAAWAEGQAMTLEQAVAYALDNEAQ